MTPLQPHATRISPDVPSAERSPLFGEVYVQIGSCIALAEVKVLVVVVLLHVTLHANNLVTYIYVPGEDMIHRMKLLMWSEV